jgi:hypothetical protein
MMRRIVEVESEGSIDKREPGGPGVACSHMLPAVTVPDPSTVPPPPLLRVSQPCAASLAVAAAVPAASRRGGSGRGRYPLGPLLAAEATLLPAPTINRAHMIHGQLIHHHRRKVSKGEPVQAIDAGNPLLNHDPPGVYIPLTSSRCRRGQLQTGIGDPVRNPASGCGVAGRVVRAAVAGPHPPCTAAARRCPPAGQEDTMPTQAASQADSRRSCQNGKGEGLDSELALLPTARTARSVLRE